MYVRGLFGFRTCSGPPESPCNVKKMKRTTQRVNNFRLLPSTCLCRLPTTNQRITCCRPLCRIVISDRSGKSSCRCIRPRPQCPARRSAARRWSFRLRKTKSSYRIRRPGAVRADGALRSRRTGTGFAPAGCYLNERRRRRRIGVEANGSRVRGELDAFLQTE